MCTGVRFSDDEGNTYFGRNLDWSFSYGETILVTPRGYHYDTVFGAGGKEKPNAVIGVGVVMADRPMYFDCANEHGLAIAGLNFPGYASFVHEPVEGTENVATFEFPLWVARNFDSVDEVEEALAAMQRSGAHLGHVRNAQGRFVGVLFLEDILEELVGEVNDAMQREEHQRRD